MKANELKYRVYDPVVNDYSCPKKWSDFTKFVKDWCMKLGHDLTLLCCEPDFIFKIKVLACEGYGSKYVVSIEDTDISNMVKDPIKEIRIILSKI